MPPRNKSAARTRVAALKVKSAMPKRVNPDTARPDMSWVVKRLKDRGVSQREVARQLDMDFASLNRSLMGPRPLRPHELAALARLCGVTSDELLSHMGLETGTVATLQIVYEITAAGEVQDLPPEERREAPRLGDVPPGSVAAVFVADRGALAPFYGQLAIFAPVDGKLGPEVMDRLAVIRYAENPALVLGTISRGSRWGRYKITRFGSADVFETGKLSGASAVVSIRSI